MQKGATDLRVLDDVPAIAAEADRHSDVRIENADAEQGNRELFVEFDICDVPGAALKFDELLRAEMHNGRPDVMVLRRSAIV